MNLLFEFLESITEKRVSCECRVYAENIFGFVSRDGDEPDISEIFHGNIGLARLTCTEKRSWSTEREIGFGDFKPISSFGEHFEPFIMRARGFAWHEETVGLMFGSPDTTAELMQLSQAEAFGLFDQNDTGIRDVDTDFDDGGGDENVVFSFFEIMHDFFFFFGFELAVDEPDGEMRENGFSQALVLYDSGFDIFHREGFFDEREDDKDLASFRDFTISESVDFFSVLVCGGYFGDNRFAIFGELVEE